MSPEPSSLYTQGMRLPIDSFVDELMKIAGVRPDAPSAVPKTSAPPPPPKAAAPPKVAPKVKTPAVNPPKSAIPRSGMSISQGMNRAVGPVQPLPAFAGRAGTMIGRNVLNRVGLWKAAGRKPTASQMIQFIKAHAPYRWGLSNPLKMRDPAKLDPKELKRAYRNMTQQSSTFEVPLQQRLESYKHWKKTGRLPQIRSKWDEARQTRRLVAEEDPQLLIHYARSPKMKELASGGSEAGFAEGFKRPLSPVQTSFVVPGQTQGSQRGMFAVPRSQEAYAAEYAPRSIGATQDPVGRPALARFRTPEKDLVTLGRPMDSGNLTEIVVPSTSPTFRDVSVKHFRDKDDIINYLAKLREK